MNINTLKTLNTLNKFVLINGCVSSIACGTKIAYELQKDEDTYSNKIIGCSFGALVGITMGFPAGVILTVTSPIVVPVLVYNKFNNK